jgi:RNA polymerase sigma-70 factor (ECF subfamily)
MPPGPIDARRLDDEELLAAIQQGEEGALAELYDRYGRPAFGLAYRILGERGSAEDVVQEAYLAVWRRGSSFRADRGSARAWLMSIVHNAAIDRRRGRFKREQEAVPIDDLAFKLEDDADDPFALVSAQIDAAQIRAALGSLPREQRDAIELAYFGGLTQQEISDRTGTPLGTVKSRMRLGLYKLRSLLAESTGGELANSTGAD